MADVRAEPGDVVMLVGPRGRTLGYGLFSDRSAIAIRLLTRDAQRPDAHWWRERLRRAVGSRDALGFAGSAIRLVHAEGDLLPSLIVDRYGEVLVVQALSQGIDRQLSGICELLIELVRPAGIVARNDPQVRALEGLTRTVEHVWGQVPSELTVTEGPVRLWVDPWKGQKTGLFLDQRENRAAAARLARGRALDCFSYTGGFALQLAAQCEHVVAVDVSADAVAGIARNASLNGLTNIEPREANAFDLLRELAQRGAQFDTIVLDPPAFAKNKGALPKAIAGYKEINLRALKLLRPGGTLMTCSCSYHVDESRFSELVAAAAIDARAQVVLVEKRQQARDHPVLLSVPETSYLKCLVLRRIG